MNLVIEFEKEDDGRWIADVMSLPGCLVYGTDKEDARRRAQALAFKVLADLLQEGQMPPITDVHFSEAA